MADQPTDQALVQIAPQQDDRVVALYNEGVALQTTAAELVVLTDEDVKAATNDLSIIAGVKKAIEEKRQEYIRPLIDYQKEINAAFKDFTAPLDEANTTYRGKVLAYRQEQERKRLEQEEINRLKEEAAQREMELKGELTEPVDLVGVTPEAPARYRTDMGTLGTAKIRKWEVEDFAQVPDRYKMVNATLIGKVVRAGEQVIPGVRIWEEESLRVTAQKPTEV